MLKKFNIKKSDFYTIPNILTYIRFLLIAPFLNLFLRDDYIGAAVCIVFSGLTDCFDGYLARKLDQVTALGKLLDPIADKLTLISVGVAFACYAPGVLPLLIVLIAKDVIMLFGGSVLVRKGLNPPAAKWYGKLGTVVFYFTVCVIIFLKAALNYENPALNIILLLITACAMVFALYKYILIFLSMLNDSKSKDDYGEN